MRRSCPDCGAIGCELGHGRKKSACRRREIVVFKALHGRPRGERTAQAFPRNWRKLRAAGTAETLRAGRTAEKQLEGSWSSRRAGGGGARCCDRAKSVVHGSAAAPPARFWWVCVFERRCPPETTTPPPPPLGLAVPASLHVPPPSPPATCPPTPPLWLLS